MSEMVLAACRAMYADLQEQSRQPYGPYGLKGEYTDQPEIDGWVDLSRLARAALRALLEPSGEMVEAISMAIFEAKNDDTPSHEAAPLLWQAAIAAALGEDR